ncbi:MAG: uracil-DNA glycosylase [Candidatus Coatesbacteria bacterium]|nr:MAG: uracil-DNA glycosylase [Candidatus Coatesbacteria bacterium]
MDNRKKEILEAVAESLSAIGVREVYLREGAASLFDKANEPRGSVPSPEGDKKELLASEAVRCEDCRACTLYNTRTNAVYGDGDIDARVMFIGEAPGAEEDKQGLPFVGRAGKLLDRLLEEVGLRRGEVYITNVLKCRPPENRDPAPEEVDACLPFLQRQMKLIAPDLIITLGLHATQLLLDTKKPMAKVRGEVFDVDGLKVLPTYHTAAALRFPAYKEQIYTDFRKIETLLDEADG